MDNLNIYAEYWKLVERDHPDVAKAVEAKFAAICDAAPRGTLMRPEDVSKEFAAIWVENLRRFKAVSS